MTKISEAYSYCKKVWKSLLEIDKSSIRAVIMGRQERNTSVLVNMYLQNNKEILNQHQGTVLEITPRETLKSVSRV